MTSIKASLTVGNDRIAYDSIAGREPGVMFCGGFMSDMTGSKASALVAHCAARSVGLETGPGADTARSWLFVHGQS